MACHLYSAKQKACAAVTGRQEVHCLNPRSLIEAQETACSLQPEDAVNDIAVVIDNDRDIMFRAQANARVLYVIRMSV